MPIQDAIAMKKRLTRERNKAQQTRDRLKELADTFTDDQQEYIEMLEKDNINLVQQTQELIEVNKELAKDIHDALKMLRDQQERDEKNIEGNINDISRLQSEMHGAKHIIKNLKDGANTNRMNLNDVIVELMTTMTQLGKNIEDNEAQEEFDKCFNTLTELTNHQHIG